MRSINNVPKHIREQIERENLVTQKVLWQPKQFVLDIRKKACADFIDVLKEDPNTNVLNLISIDENNIEQIISIDNESSLDKFTQRLTRHNTVH